MKKLNTISKELALQLADNLIATEPRFRDSRFAKLTLKLKKGCEEFAPLPPESPPYFDQFRELNGMFKGYSGGKKPY